MQVTFVRDCQHCSKPFEIDVLCAHLVMGRHTEMAGCAQCLVGIFAGHLKHCALDRSCLSVNEIHDGALMLTDNSCMWFGHEILNRGRVPVITARHAAAVI